MSGTDWRKDPKYRTGGGPTLKERLAAIEAQAEPEPEPDAPVGCSECPTCTADTAPTCGHHWGCGCTYDRQRPT